jgi:hypothetical protein
MVAGGLAAKHGPSCYKPRTSVRGD